MPEPRPLYNLPELLKTGPSAPVIVAEGKKLADAEKHPTALDCSAPDDTLRLEGSGWLPVEAMEFTGRIKPVYDVAVEEEHAGRIVRRG